MSNHAVNSRFYIFGGTALISLSLCICLASASWGLLIEPTPTAISSGSTVAPIKPSGTPTGSPSTPTSTPTPLIPTPEQTALGGGSTSDNVSSRSTRTPVSNLPRPSPTKQPVAGIVATDFGRLNIRRGPSVDYDLIGRLENGDRVTIRQRTSASDWLKVETADQEIGWVSEQYVEISGNLSDVPVATNLEAPPLRPRLLRPPAVCSP